MKKKRFCAVIAFVFFAFCGVLVLSRTQGCFLVVSDDPINQSNFAKIKEGMSLKEVEHLLGKNTRDPFLCIDATEWLWDGPEAKIIVVVGEGDTVISTFFTPKNTQPKDGWLVPFELGNFRVVSRYPQLTSGSQLKPVKN
jgi:hypothetical protein